MAGSYNHVVNKKGQLRKPDDLLGMLEARGSGDVYEAVEEMYGMIWLLGSLLAKTDQWADKTPEELVEFAREQYREGLVVSPGVKR